MNPMLAESLASILRWALAIGAGYIVRSGIWTSEAAEVYVAGGALAILSLAWSQYQKWNSRATLNTALASPTPMSEDQAKAKAKLPSAPSVTTASDVTPSATPPS